MTRLDPTDTIAAIASPPGGGYRGLVRVTGSSAFSIVLEDLVGEVGAPPSRAERRSGTLRVDGLRRSLEVEISFWPGSKTYTGQPLVEIQTVGSPPILQQVLASFLARGARLAEPGEFTLRAFLSGRIDLTRAEAVLEVIDAGSSDQLDVALRQLAGGLGEPLTRLRDELADTLAHLEANLDFADEADVDPLGRASLAETLHQRANDLAALVARLGERVRTSGRPRVVLVGPPNAGKSRLFNALIGLDRAIVSARAGTTRDYLEAACDCDGLIVDLVDTAGIESVSTAVESRAQEARVEQSQIADLLLDCRSLADPRDDALPNEHSTPRLPVATKLDLVADEDRPASDQIRTSATNGQGVAGLRSAIARSLQAQVGDGLGATVASTAARCGESLRDAARSLQAAADAIHADHGDEMVAVDLRQAIDDLGRVVGAVVTDDLLDRIFRKFCIGK